MLLVRLPPFQPRWRLCRSWSGWKRKSARDISLYTFLLFCFGLLMWLMYGLTIHSLPVILANLVTLGIALAILALKIRYDYRDARAIHWKR